MKAKIGKFPKGVTHRKVDIDIERFDTWSMDHSLALIIYPMLLQLRQSKQGVPSEIVNGVGGEDYSDQQCFDFYKETYDESFQKACERWDEILDKMIWSFEQILKDEYDQLYHHGSPKFDWVECDHTFYNPITKKTEKTFQMVDTNPNEHWYDNVGHQLHEARIQEGLELFGKYYRNLWD